jgi:hypothetical protein
VQTGSADNAESVLDPGVTNLPHGHGMPSKPEVTPKVTPKATPKATTPTT